MRSKGTTVTPSTGDPLSRRGLLTGLAAIGAVAVAESGMRFAGAAGENSGTVVAGRPGDITEDQGIDGLAREDGIDARQARLFGPAAITLDPVQGLLICDALNRMVRRVDAGGRIWNVAGNGRYGGSLATTDDLVKSTALPSALQYLGPRLEREKAAGRRFDDVDWDDVPELHDGNGAAASGPHDVALGFAGDLAVDGDGRLLVADPVGFRVLRIDPRAGTVEVYVGRHNAYGPVQAKADRRSAVGRPTAVATGPGGEAYLADSDGFVVRRVSGDDMDVVVGSGAEGPPSFGSPATGSPFGGAVGLAVSEAGELHVADEHYGVVFKVDGGGRLAGVVGDGTRDLKPVSADATKTALYMVGAVRAAAGGGLLVVDQGAGRVLGIDGDGRCQLLLGGEVDRAFGTEPVYGYAGGIDPIDAAVDPGTGDLLIADWAGCRVLRFAR